MTVRTIEWFRDFGPITPTRHERLHLLKLSRDDWRFLATDDLGDTDFTGPIYRTRAEALSMVDHVAAWFGVS